MAHAEGRADHAEDQMDNLGGHLGITDDDPLGQSRPGDELALLASLLDLDREHAVGDLSDADYIQLRDEYIARTATAIRSRMAVEPDAHPLSGTRDSGER